MSENNGEVWLLQSATCSTSDATRFAGEIPHLDLAPDPRLTAEGWQRRFMADPIRAREAVCLYSELGFEVRLEAAQPSELSLACGDCRLATCLAYQTIYTRKQ